MITQPSLMARVDLIALTALTFPIPFVMPFAVLFWVDARFIFPQLWESILSFPLLMLFAFTLATIVDRIRGWLGPAAVPIPTTALSRLAAGRTGEGQLPQHIFHRMKVASSDLSVGAHVRGIVRPYLVVSGGMLIGLLRNDKRAEAMLLHESAHIVHWDRGVSALIGLLVFEGVGRVVKFSMEYGSAGQEMVASAFFLAAYQIVVFGAVLCFFSRYREYYADAKAVAGGAEASYLKLLEHASAQKTNARFSFFHPPLASRVRQIELGFPVLKTVWAWRIYVLLNLAVSWFQWRMSNDSDDAVLLANSTYFYSSMVMSVVLLCIEPLRKKLLSASDAFVSSAGELISALAPGKGTLRIGGLLLGFLAVVILSDFSGSHGATVRVVGAAVVYTIFRMTK